MQILGNACTNTSARLLASLGKGASETILNLPLISTMEA